MRSATRRPVVASRPRGHSLAPAHIGEAGSVAVLALAVLGLAVFIAAVAMIVSGLTAAARFVGAEPPPNAGELGSGQVLGGIGLLVLGVALTASALAVLADIRAGRLAATIISGIAAVLSAIGVATVVVRPAPDPVLASALAVATVIFAGAAVILGRPRR